MGDGGDVSSSLTPKAATEHLWPINISSQCLHGKERQWRKKKYAVWIKPSLLKQTANFSHQSDIASWAACIFRSPQCEAMLTGHRTNGSWEGEQNWDRRRTPSVIDCRWGTKWQRTKSVSQNQIKTILKAVQEKQRAKRACSEKQKTTARVWQKMRRIKEKQQQAFILGLRPGVMMTKAEQVWRSGKGEEPRPARDNPNKEEALTKTQKNQGRLLTHRQKSAAKLVSQRESGRWQKLPFYKK